MHTSQFFAIYEYKYVSYDVDIEVINVQLSSDTQLHCRDGFLYLMHKVKAYNSVKCLRIQLNSCRVCIKIKYA